MAPVAEEITALPKLRLQRPSRSCRDELSKPAFANCVPSMADVVDDVAFKVQQLMYEPLPVALSENELFAIVAYTYDSQSGEQEGQLYFELNRDIRRRDAASRTAVLQLWGGFLFYLMSALSKLPDVPAVVYRGYPDAAMVTRQYTVGRPVQWGAFSSTSTNADVTKQFTDQQRGVIFKLTLVAGKAIKAYSYFPTEDEVLISAQARFTVSSTPYTAADGYTYVDMVETHGTPFIS